MDNRLQSYLTILCILVFTEFVQGQDNQQPYHISIRPDIWYNDVDGIRVGTYFHGRVLAGHEEGPHRLDSGVWLSTWFPSLPVSYTLTFTEPVPRFSDYGSELNAQIFSSIREGYHTHGASVNKRWQETFDYRRYWEFSIAYSFEKRFDHEYSVFPELWSDTWKGIISPGLLHQSINRAGVFNLGFQTRFNTIDTFFYTISLMVSQQFLLGRNWDLRLRSYGEMISDDAFPEYKLFRSSGSEITTIDRAYSRSKGTVPVNWVRNGNVHFASGPNLRGYTKSDVNSIRENNPFVYNSIAAFNLEFGFPNPVQSAIRNIEYVSEFLSFRSYFFSDAGTATGNQASKMDGFYINAGAGLALTLNIPDYLGKPRGFVVRYEVPFWLSDPESEENWKWRHLFGLGATITF